MIARAVLGTGSTAATIAAALLIAIGVPLAWVWIASQLYGKPGAITGPVAVFVATGILVSYWGLLLLASWIRARFLARDVDRTVRRQSWNRSMRDTPFRPGHSRSDPIERLFVVTAIISMIIFAIWFAFFAGAPFPASPG